MLGLLIIFILTILPILLLQKIQHLLMVDWSDRLQEGVGQIFVGKKRSHFVRRWGALGQRNFWTDFKNCRRRDRASVCLYRPLSRGGSHPILSFRGRGYMHNLRISCGENTHVGELFSGGWWWGDEVGRHLLPRGACSTTLSVSTHGLECGQLRTGCKRMMSLDWSHSTNIKW